jgi:hypothetical protein
VNEVYLYVIDGDIRWAVRRDERDHLAWDLCAVLPVGPLV